MIKRVYTKSKYQMWQRIVLLLCGLWACLYVSAQNNSIPQDELLVMRQGLSQGMVFSVLQTSDNFLWVATKDGLNRYDGHRFEVFLPDPFNPYSVASAETRKLFEDKDGYLWVVYQGGIDVYIPDKGRFLHLNWANKKLFDGREVDFTQSPDGTVWAADGKCLWKFSQPQNILVQALTQDKSEVWLNVANTFIDKVQPISGNSLFIHVKHSNALGLVTATDEGLYKVQEQTLALTPVNNALARATCFIVGEDKNGALWVQRIYKDKNLSLLFWSYGLKQQALNNSEMWVFDGKNNTTQHSNLRGSTLTQFDHEGNLWQYSQNNLHAWKPSVFLLGGLPHITMVCKEAFTQVDGYYCPALTIDRSGVAWLGTSGYGLLKGAALKPKINRLSTYVGMRKIHEDPSGLIFFSTTPKTAYKNAHLSETLLSPWVANLTDNTTPNLSFNTLAFDQAGNMWINNNHQLVLSDTAYQNGLLRIDAFTRKVTYFNWAGIGLVCASNGTLVSATPKGLYTLNPATLHRAFYPFPTPQPMPHYTYYAIDNLFAGHNGDIWITDMEGFIHAAPTQEGYTFTHYQTDPANRQSLSNNVVLCVVEDPMEPSKYLWIGTKGGGLNRMDRQTGSFKHYKRAQGLPDDVIYALLPDEQGHIWLSTNNGLCRFHVRTETIHNFTTADGLPGNEFNKSSYLKTKDGHLFFGGVNGAAYFHPDSLQFNRRPPATRITRLYVNNQPALIELPKQETAANDPQQPVLLPTDIAYTQHITLPYHQNLLTFEFAALDFTNPSQNQYRYQLQGLDPDLVNLGNKNTVQFANLKPGNYTFTVMGSNNDGAWSAQPALLHIRILPPWWQTIWAYSFYFLFAGSVLFIGYRYQLRRQWEQQENLRLKELDDFKNRFFTNITHEFRTPLTVILGAGNELEHDLTPHTNLPAAIATKLHLIKRSGENLLRLINQILDLSKLESGNLQLKWVQGNVAAYIRYIAESLQSLANAQQVTLQVNAQVGELVMDYDPERLLQIVYNLLSNAIKFTPPGGQVALSINLIHDAASGKPQLQLSVTDSGIGISPKDLPYIFNRFYQANNLAKAKTGGTGIGLALTQELVKAMGGNITASSQPNIATTFTVILPKTNNAPFAPDDWHYALYEIPTTLPQPQKPSANPANTNETKPTLLLIEDNPDVMAYLSALLQQHYHLHHAYNGQEGIDLALQFIPDMIVSDVMMPNKDGFEVCQFLKNNEFTSHIPIVLLTAKADVQNRIIGLKKGADAYLAKPFHKEELLATLTNLLDLRQKMQIKFAASLLQTTHTDNGQPKTIQPDEPALPANLEPQIDIDYENAFLAKLTHILDQHLDNSDFGVPELCHQSGISQAQLYRKIKALTNLSIAAFIRRYRLEKGKALLETTPLTMAEIAYSVGFSSPGYFSNAFFEEFGARPQYWRK